MISLSTIPADIRVPGQYLEIDASKAVAGATAPQRILLVGQRGSTSTVGSLTLTRIVSAAQAAQAFGRGSMLAQMAAALKLANDTTECWAIALDEPGNSTTAQRVFQFGGPATDDGAIAMRVADVPVTVAVSAGDTSTTIAANVAAAINALPDLPVVGIAAQNVLRVKARNTGLAGNDIDVRANFYQGEQLPPGVQVTRPGDIAGVGVPDLSPVWAMIGDERFAAIVTPYTDAASLTSIETELASRWGPMRQLETIAFGATRQTLAQAAALGGARNSAFVTLLPMADALTPTWKIAAAYAGVVMLYGGIDPSRPFQGLPLPGITPPVVDQQFTAQERDLLLQDGMSTFTVVGGVVLIERPITTFQTDGYGLPSVAFLDVNTPLTLAYLRQSLRARIASKFARMKLADDGTNFGVGQAIVTPSIIRAEILALAREWEDAGQVEDLDQFKAGIIVERDANDRNRVNALIPPNLVNQFRVFAGAIQFLL